MFSSLDIQACAQYTGVWWVIWFTLFVGGFGFILVGWLGFFFKASSICVSLLHCERSIQLLDTRGRKPWLIEISSERFCFCPVSNSNKFSRQGVRTFTTNSSNCCRVYKDTSPRPSILLLIIPYWQSRCRQKNTCVSRICNFIMISF